MSQETQGAPYKRHTLRQRRKKTSIRVDPELWQKFREDLKKKGLSSCLVLDGLVSAWVYGGAMVPGQGQPLKVDLTLEEHVSRRRRGGGDYPPKKKPRENHYDPYQGWTYDPDLRPGLTIVEQPRQWKGDDKGFKWNEEAQLWWRLE